MNSVLPFLVIGITAGSVYGLTAMGLVLTYKTSGIFNFAHGSIAAISAYAFYDFRELRGLPWPLALILAVVVLPPLVALVMERIARRLAGGTTTAKIVGAVGIQVAITGALAGSYGGAPVEFPGFLPTSTVRLFGINVGIDQLTTVIISVAGAVAFFAFFRYSALGVRMRAVVDNPDLLELAGTGAFSVRARAWLFGCWVAGLSGVLLAPELGLNVVLLTALVSQAFGAAAIGLFRSLPLTYAGGLLVGILAAFATRIAASSPSLTGLPTAIPFLVLFAVLLLAGRRNLTETGSHRPSPAPAPLVTGWRSAAVGAAAVMAAAVVPLVVGPRLPVYAIALVFVLIFSSLHLLVRMSGQVSLVHAGLVAVGAAAFSHFAAGAGLPWLVAVLLAGVVAVPVGALVAIPSIRLSGLFLALAPFGLGLLMQYVLYGSSFMFGPSQSAPSPRPHFAATDVAFYYVLLAAAAGGGLLVAVIARSRLGRLLRAMADSPDTLSTLGLGVNVTRVTVFAIAAFVAGVAGALYAAQTHTADALSFNAFNSLTWLTILILGRGLRSAAPVAAAIVTAIIPGYITSAAITNWLTVAFGAGAVAVAMQEAARSGRPGSAAPRAAVVPATISRAAERIGAGNAAAERLREVQAAHRTGPEPALRVVIGTGNRGIQP